MCKTNQCGCRKRGSLCGPGCRCHNCTNTEAHNQHDSDIESDSDTESDAETDSDSIDSEYDEYIQTEVITDTAELDMGDF